MLLFCCSCLQPKETTTLKIEIITVIQKADSKNVFYTTNHSIEYNETDSFWKKVNGSGKNQKIPLLFPKYTLPKQIRIDFGNTIELQEIILNNIDFQYKDKRFSLQGKEIYYYFIIDESVTELDKELCALKRKDSSQTRDPSLYPRGNKLTEQLNLLYTKEANVQ